MLILFVLTFLLAVPQTTSLSILDCSVVRCAKPECEYGYYTPKGECCPVCNPDCSVFACEAPGCKDTDTFTPEGECCPMCKEKSGTCPVTKPLELGICVEDCSSDHECFGNQKCCSNGCGHTCQEPIPDCSMILCDEPVCKDTDIITMPEGGCCPVCKDCSMTACEDPICKDTDIIMPEGECCPICKEKSGTCPVIQPWEIGICVEDCSSDHDCFGKQKCCSNGCGHTCQQPIPDCSMIQCDEPRCKDTDIITMPEGGCCPVCKDCSVFACEVPRCKETDIITLEGECCPICKERPGTCPKPEPLRVGTCVEQCSSDHDCSVNQKCCSNGCGHTCQQPIPDCSLVRCDLPVCKNGEYTPIGECCPVCKPDCSLVRCALPVCKNGEYTPIGECCPVCKPDCSRIACLVPECKGTDIITTPEGECCPVCKDCSTVRCAKPVCKFGFYTPVGKCCPVCKPDCSTVRCARPVCKHGFYTPDGKCCPVCKDCSMVTTCVRPMCDDSYTPEGECCPICPPACLQPKKPGPCKAAFPRYFYNTETCQCEYFKWGGCQPNGNNFPSLARCQAACELPMKSNPICELPKISGICQAYMPRWFYNTESCQCENFIYGGCGGNANRFFTEEECKANCKCWDCDVCNLPIKPHGGGEEICAAYFPSYGYNITSCQCEKFIYSGCDGNANRFGSLEKCNERCGDTDCDTHVCDLPIKPDDGGDIICLAYIPSYGYNSTSCKCEKFIYSGCGGNANRFGTLEQCEKLCKGHCEPQTPCEQPADPGPCKAFVRRFYYDPSDCKCKRFKYGGCKGNSNNFRSKRKCKKSCGSTCSICSEPMKVGPCEGTVKRFYYDPLTNKCKQFSWGGCQPNGNNFKKKRLCKVCIKPVCSLPPYTGPCKAAITRYYYDAASRTCKTFLWGGCDSNGNNFGTIKSCKRKCMKQIKAIGR